MINTIAHDDDTESQQVLKFLPVTGLQRDEESRRIVRSHAIRDANRRKRVTPGEIPRKIPDRERLKPLPQAQLTTKFRLDTKPKRKTVVHQVPGKEYRDLDDSLEALAVEIKAPTRRGQSIPIIPRVGRFDPFDTLPVRIGAKQQALIQYREFHLDSNTLTC